MKKYDIAIIGGGPGGLYAHYYAHLKSLTSCLIEANNNIGGQPAILFAQKAVHDFPGFKDITGKEIIDRLYSLIDNQDNIFCNNAAKSINKTDGGFMIETTHNTFNANYVIIATGGGFFSFNKIDGIESDCVHYSVKDINLYKDKKIIVAGGGDSAIDWVIEILKRKLTPYLTIVHRRDEFRATGKKIQELLSYKPHILFNKSSKVIERNKVKITDRISNKEDVLDFDFLLVQYGLSYSLQDNELLKGFNLDKYNRINVNANGKTNIEDIYAIGNVANFENKPKLISIAITDAIKAIDNIVANIKKYE